MSVYFQTNYRFNFLAIKAEYWNTDYMIIHAFDTKKLNRTYSYWNVNFTQVKEVDNIMVNIS